MAFNSHPGGAVLVTDAMCAMGLPPGRHMLGALEVDVLEMRRSESHPGGGGGGGAGPRTKKAVLVGTDTLAGSVVSMDTCVRNYIDFTGCAVAEALEAASLHPARAIGVSKTKGSLEPGKDADFCLLDPDTLEVRATFVSGVQSFGAPGWEMLTVRGQPGGGVGARPPR